MFETFVAGELRKQISYVRIPLSLLHFRLHSGDEVDFVLERNDGKIVGIEAKSSSKVMSDDFSGLRALKSIAGKDFMRGIVIYTATKSLAFEKDLWTLPVSCLWESLA